MPITGISHVAYRCASAAQTVQFYSGVLGMPYRYAIAENKVPSTGEHFPHIHIFIEIAPGTYLGFFELADAPPLSFDKSTPRWVQHLALRVESVQEVHEFRERLVAAGIEVVGVTDHGIFQSIYCFDPSGHRIEITCETMSPETYEDLTEEAQSLLDEWTATKRAPDVSWHRRSAI
jgi:catechol 2,3-dioxygenase-like lactoylglutathione lyase family enzyme